MLGFDFLPLFPEAHANSAAYPAIENSGGILHVGESEVVYPPHYELVKLRDSPLHAFAIAP